MEGCVSKSVPEAVGMGPGTVLSCFVRIRSRVGLTHFQITWLRNFTCWITRNTPTSVAAKGSRLCAGWRCWDWRSGDSFSFRPIFCLVCYKGCHSHEITTDWVFPFGKSVCFLPLLCISCQLPTHRHNQAFSHDVYALFGFAWTGTLWMSLELRAGRQWCEASLMPSPVEGPEELHGP